MATPSHRNLLERLVREGRRTIAETCAAYEKSARAMGEPATLSPRQLARWMSGEVGRPRPVAQRVAERFWGYGFEVLLGPATEPEADRAIDIAATVRGALPGQRGQVGPDSAAAVAPTRQGGLPPELELAARPQPCPWADPVADGEPAAAGGREAGDSTNRRQAMHALGGAAVSAAFGGLFGRAAADAMEFTRRAETTDLGPLTLDHLELAIAGMARAFASTPPVQMFSTALAYRRRVAGLIDGRQTLRQRCDLYRKAGWLSIILGWLSHDLGDPLAAEAHCLDAWEHGWQAEDGEVCAWAMDTAASVAMYHHRPARARDAALKGLDQAKSGGPAAVRLSCQLTRAYGRPGAVDRFDEALADTRRRFEGLPSHGSGLFSADAGRIASYAATASIWLDRTDDAVRYAHDALAFYAHVDLADRSPTREAISRLDLGLALIAKDQPDGTAEQVLLALDSERITGAVLARAGEVDAALLRTHPKLPATREAHDRYLALTQPLDTPQISAASAEPTANPAAHRGSPL